MDYKEQKFNMNFFLNILLQFLTCKISDMQLIKIFVLQRRTAHCHLLLSWNQ